MKAKVSGHERHNTFVSLQSANERRTQSCAVVRRGGAAQLVERAQQRSPRCQHFCHALHLRPKRRAILQKQTNICVALVHEQQKHHKKVLLFVIICRILFTKDNNP